MTGHHHIDDHIGDHADDQADRDELDGLAAEHDYDYHDYDFDGFDSGWSPELEARLTDVCWAVAARDCALEVGDRSAAAGFAEQARDAIAKAVAAGIAPTELADELGYPGGHTAMDGPHIDDEIAALRPPAQPDPPTRADRPTAVSAAAGLAAAAAVTADGEAGDAARDGPAHPLAPRRPLRTQRRRPRRRGSRCGSLRPRPRHPPTSTTTGGRDGHPDPYQSRFVPSPPVDSAVVDSPSSTASSAWWVRAVIWLPGLAVALGAAAATAHGLFEVALAARVPAGIAWLYPLITDGLALVAYAATARLTGGATRYAWSVVVLGGRAVRARPGQLPGRRRHPRRPTRLCGSASEPGPRSPPRSSRTCSTCSPPTPHPPRTTSIAHDDEQLSTPHPDPASPPSSAGRGPEWVDPGGEESDPTAGRPTAVTMRGDDAEPAEPSAPGPSASPAVQPGVQPAVYGTEPVQPALYNAVAAELAARRPADRRRPAERADTERR